MATLGYKIDDFYNLINLSVQSLLLGFCALFLSFLFALPIGYIYTFKGSFSKKIISFTIILLAVLPPFFLSMLLSNLFFHMDIKSGFISLVFAHMIPIYPYTLILMILGFSFVPQNAIYSAKIYCKNSFAGFYKFYFPFMKNQFLVAILLGLSISLSQYIITLMLSSPNFSTLMVEIVPFLQSGDLKSAASYGIVFLINTPLVLFGIYKVMRLKNGIS